MMRLRSDFDRQFKTELIAYEKELQMPYVTSIERLAREEGREEGSSAIVLKQLARFCGSIPLDVEEHVRHLSFDQLQQLGESLFEFQSLTDLKQ